MFEKIELKELEATEIVVNDSTCCQFCDDENTNNHHLFSRGLFGKFPENNFVLRLCRNHHQQGVEKYVTKQLMSYGREHNEEISRIVIRKDLEKFVRLFLIINAEFFKISVDELLGLIGEVSVETIVSVFEKNKKHIFKTLKKKVKNCKQLDEDMLNIKQVKRRNKQPYTVNLRVSRKLLMAKYGKIDY